MKRVILSALVMGTAVLYSACATRNSAQTAAGTDTYDTYGVAPDGLSITSPAATNDPWPMTFTDSGNNYTVYEPQCDSWNGHEMVGRSAVAVQPAAGSGPVYGVVSFTAFTLVDKDSRTAKLADFKLTSSDFPSARAQGQTYLAPVLIQFSKNAPPVPLNHLENNLVMTDAPKAERVNNTPPKIITANRPAVLVYVDGTPAWRPVAGTDLQRIINTRMLVLKDRSGHVYLHLFDGYLQASSLDGPWTVAIEPPAGADIAAKAAQDSGQVDLMAGTPDSVTQKEPSLKTSAVPDIYVETKPSELVVFNGPPEYASIPGTDLLYASNTSGNVFKLLTDQQNYLLISGRWYRASSLNGPWQFVPGNELPKDFANIPDDSPKENVKASVPGTQQAAEALIANSIPQSTAVSRNTPMPAPQIDGAPRLAPISGTPLHYVQNSSVPIIEVDPQSWYACQNGVWYAATSDQGPWSVAASVPAVIYTIPPDSPLHYLTYVQVYGSTPDSVYEGYTPGYFGTEVADYGTVVYGTGYDYEPWVGTVWYGPPITWGCGFGPCWTPWWGWGFNCGFGWGWGWGWGGFGWAGCYPPYPWWCGFRGFDHDWFRDHHFAGRGFDRFHDRGGWAYTGADLYRHGAPFAGNHFAAANVHATGRNDFGRAYNSRTGQLAAGEHARVQNVTGSAWNPGRQASVAANRNFNAGFAGGNHRNMASRSDNRFNTFNYGVAQTRAYNSAPRFGGVNPNFPRYSYGWRGGNNFGVVSRGDGWSQSAGGFNHGYPLPQRAPFAVGPAVHGGGFFGGGGFRGGGGGGGSFHGGGGGGGGGVGHGGGHR